uniref:Peptidase S1 domain-containing protein n=1 Tax=Spermophilus dauricus TaxID=99837 RepID=A0A8C9QD90_SPEDA
MKPLLLLLVFLLCPRTEAGKIIGGREAVPHSHPHMAFLRIQTLNTTELCGGFLVREDFVVTAAHWFFSPPLGLKTRPRVLFPYTSSQLHPAPP